MANYSFLAISSVANGIQTEVMAGVSLAILLITFIGAATLYARRNLLMMGITIVVGAGLLALCYGPEKIQQFGTNLINAIF